MENDNAKTAIDTLASDSNLIGCTWDERGITPIRDTSAAPLPLRECGVFRFNHAPRLSNADRQ